MGNGRSRTESRCRSIRYPEIEGHLPEEGIDDILDDSGKPGSESVVEQVA